MLQRLITELSEELGVAALESHEGVYCCQFGSHLDVTISASERGDIRLHACLAPLPQEHVESYLAWVMEANLFGQETGDNFLGLDHENKQVTLTRWIDQHVDYREFRSALESFLNYSDTWQTDTNTYTG